jgi:hypothetical protein
MALYFKTATPNSLLSAFKKAIDDGRVETWSYDADGDFTHTPPQWKKLAWLRPKVQEGKLALFILKPSNGTLTREVYAVYHGRFSESMITHCHSLFIESSATADAVSGDIV